MGVAEDEIEAYKKKDQYAGGEFTIKRVVKEAEETAEQIATRIMEFMAMLRASAILSSGVMNLFLFNMP